MLAELEGWRSNIEPPSFHLERFVYLQSIWQGRSVLEEELNEDRERVERVYRDWRVRIFGYFIDLQLPLMLPDVQAAVIINLSRDTTGRRCLRHRWIRLAPLLAIITDLYRVSAVHRESEWRVFDLASGGTGIGVGK